MENSKSNEMTASEKSTMQVFVADLTWNPNQLGNYRVKYEKYDELPRTFTLDIPTHVVERAEKKNISVEDAIETFVYDFMTHKFNHEVYHCSIFLPLDI